MLVWFREIRVVPGTPDGFEAGWGATGVNRCTRVRIVFHSARTSTRQDRDSARVLARVSVPVGHFIRDGPGACPVASIGLRSFRVYRGVSGCIGTPDDFGRARDAMERGPTWPGVCCVRTLAQ